MENRDPTLCVYRVYSFRFPLPFLPMNSLPSYLFRSRFAPFQIGFSCIHPSSSPSPSLSSYPSSSCDHPTLSWTTRMSSCGNRFIRLCSREKEGEKEGSVSPVSRQVGNVNTRVLDSCLDNGDIKLSDRWNICNEETKGEGVDGLFAKFVVASRMLDWFFSEFGYVVRCMERLKNYIISVSFYLFNIYISKENLHCSFNNLKLANFIFRYILH